MSLFKFSFNQKIQLYTFTVILISLIFTALAYLIFEKEEYQNDLIETLALKADFIGNYNALAIVKEDNKEVKKSLEFIEKDPYITGIWVYANNFKQIVAFDPQSLAYQELPEPYRSQGSYLEDNNIMVVRDIYYNSHPIGKVMIVYQLEKAKNHFQNELIKVIIISLLSLFAALLISYFFQRSITKPLQSLVQTVTTVTQRKDFNLRATKFSEDDFGTLADSFNTLLREVQARENALIKSEERLNLALWGSSDIMFDWDVLNNIWYFDESLEELLDLPKTEMPKNREAYFKLVFPQEVSLVEENLQTHLLGESPLFRIEHRIHHKSGRWIWIFVRGKVVERNQRGKALRMAGTLMDITVRKRAEEKLKLFNKVFESTTEGVMVTDPKFRIVEINPAFSVITGYSRQDITGKTMDILHSEKQNENFYRRMYSALELKGSWQGELWEKRKNGEVYPQRLTINSMINEKNLLTHYVAIFSDITTFKQTEEELNFLTHYDALTGLPNRTLFMSHFENEIKRAQASEKKIAIVLLGLDNFKIINDSYGHAIGDALLQSVAKRLLQCIEKQDLVARVTGDEFALIVEQAGTRVELKKFARNVLEKLCTPFIIKSHDIMVGASMGVSFFPEDSTQSQELFLQADTALYIAKQSGRNCHKFYTPDMNAQVQKRQRMETLIKNALTNEEFTVLYQPMIDAKTEKIYGAEALLRWENKELGWVSPQEFIPVAEESGAIVSLGLWVLKTACIQNKQWEDLGFDLRIGVNLSAYQFRSGDLVEEIAKLLNEIKMQPRSLDLELTEGALMDNAERCILMLEVLKTMGISISVDDFGTGYSSLSYLRRFPIDALKIDRSFISHVCTNPEDASIVKAIIAMAKGLKLKIIAEGVENQEQARYLIEQGVDVFQGFYYSLPLTAAQFTERLQANLFKATAT